MSRCVRPDVGFQCQNDRECFSNDFSVYMQCLFVVCNSVIGHEYLLTSNTKLYPCSIERRLNIMTVALVKKNEEESRDWTFEKIQICIWFCIIALFEYSNSVIIRYRVAPLLRYHRIQSLLGITLLYDPVSYYSNSVIIRYHVTWILGFTILKFSHYSASRITWMTHYDSGSVIILYWTIWFYYHLIDFWLYNE